MKKRDWLPFEEARAFVRTLGLKNQQQWIAYYRSGQKPENIPAIPQKVYPTDFKGYGDWLGSGFVARQKRRFLPFKEARAFVRTLGLRDQKQWRAYHTSGGQRPENIPTNPRKVYQAQWRGWGDWLGVQHHWSKLAIIAFLEDLRSQIDSLSEQELYVLLQRRRVLPALRLALHKMSTLQIIRTIADPASASTVERALRKLPAEEVASYADESEEVQPFLDEQTLSDFTNLNNPVSPSFLTEESASANSTSSEIERMQNVDTLISLLGEQDLDLVEDLIATRARLLWDRYSQQGKSVVQEIQAASGGIFFHRNQRSVSR